MYHKNTRYQSSKFFLKSTRPVEQVFPNCTRPIPPALPHRSLTLDYFNIDTGLAYDSVRCSDAQIVSGSKSWKAFKFHGCGYVLVINIFTFHFLPQMYWWHLIVYIEGNLYFFIHSHVVLTWSELKLAISLVKIWLWKAMIQATNQIIAVHPSQLQQGSSSCVKCIFCKTSGLTVIPWMLVIYNLWQKKVNKIIYFDDKFMSL